MQLQLYPNRELRALYGLPRAVSRSDANAVKRERRSPLVIPLQVSQAKPRQGYKRGPLTNKARHKILHHCALMKDCDKDRQLFLLGTLPGSTDAALSEMVRLAPYIVKAVQTYLPRLTGQSARTLRYVWVWELQTRKALHMHLVVECPSREIAEVVHAGWRQCWIQCMRAAQRKASVDLFERAKGGTHADDSDSWICSPEWVRSSVARYLSKYASKGSNGESSDFPPRWYGISSALRRDYEKFKMENHRIAVMTLDVDTPVMAPRIMITQWLEEECGRRATPKQSRSDSTGVDVFSYLPDGKTLDECWDSLQGFLSKFGIMKVAKRKEREPVTIRAAVRRLNREIEEVFPDDMVIQLGVLCTEPIWNKLQVNIGVTESDLQEYYYAYRYMFNLRGYKFGDAPPWARSVGSMFERELGLLGL